MAYRKLLLSSLVVNPANDRHGELENETAAKVAADLRSKGKIDAKYLGAINKLQQGEELVSVDTLNRYVHSPNFNVSPDHLRMLWGTLADFVVLCLEA
jgi:hypothetical protein